MRHFIIEYNKKDGLWICTHLDSGVYCQFKELNFNRTNQFNLFEYSTTPINQLNQIVDQMINWLHKNHFDKL
ncbi:Uncharacterised protein [Sphingobacterium spiritivorum]|uniref:Uncharacterized protein n=1 Tax=Sphingobacterium spiritivorum ATCC 33861 TaxID=525373 RepID=D7VTL9_SPHSI|nr:hypothetical protein HMPREF0766_14339 [Sphingobacterium spiritivorum ATCC 33861]SUJ29539.1 Uncharacterised protein [Sphingobacterium spiritivorum]